MGACLSRLSPRSHAFAPLATLAIGCARLLGALRQRRDGDSFTVVDDTLRAADRALAAAERWCGTSFADPEAPRDVTLDEALTAARVAVWSIGRSVGDGEARETVGCFVAIAREAFADIRHLIAVA